MDFSSEKSSKRTSLTTKTGETLVSAAEKGDTNALRSLLKVRGVKESIGNYTQ